MKLNHFTILGWHIYISRSAMKKRSKNRNAKRVRIHKQRLEMAEHRCEICGKPVTIKCSLHHLLPVGSPDRNEVKNVIVLCTDCHHRVQKEPHYLAIAQLESDTRWDDSEPIPEV